MRNLIAERGLGLPREPRGPVVTSTSRHTHRTRRTRSGPVVRRRPTTRSPGSRRSGPGCGASRCRCPNNSLRYVLVYLFETDRGPYLIDAGWNTDDAFGALQRGMEEAGCDVADVQGVLVTHIHPDHYGLAGRIREASGAWISLHPADAELIHDRYDEPEDLLEPGGRRAAPHGRAGRGAGAAAQRRHAGPPPGRRRSSPTCCSRTGRSPRCRAGT